MNEQSCSLSPNERRSPDLAWLALPVEPLCHAGGCLAHASLTTRLSRGSTNYFVNPISIFMTTISVFFLAPLFLALAGQTGYGS